MSDKWESFLKAIASPNPKFGSVEWDNGRVLSLTIRFARQGDDADTIRARARRYFERLSAAERSLLHITVHKQNGVPIWAQIRPRPGAAKVLKLLETSRLRQLDDPQF